jgi:purine-binding chemotaxis protein CheW
MLQESALPASMPDDDEPGHEGDDNQFVTFLVEGELFAAPMAPVQEIIRVPALARVPLAPASLLGLANLRGRVLPIVNLRRIFGLADVDNTDATRALVINLGTALGFVVDRVASVIAVNESQIEPVASIRSTIDNDLLTGVVRLADNQLVMVLDFGRLIAREFAAIAAIQPAASTFDAATGNDPGPGEESEGDEVQLVSFSVEGQEYAVDIDMVQEIVQMPDRTVSVPNAQSHVVGLMTLRERLLPLVSLRALLGLPRVEGDVSQRVVVLGLSGNRAVGVVADTVDEVLRVPRHLVEPLPSLLAQENGIDEVSSVCRLDGGKRLVSILDTLKMFEAGNFQSVLAQAAVMEDHMSDADQRDSDDDLPEDEEQVVVFRLGTEEFAVPIAAVQEIVRVPDVLTHVPKAPDYVEGVINLRGYVLPVMDQRRRLGLADAERNDAQRIMVYAYNGMRMGFIVDAVSEVLKIPRSAIEVSPKMSGEQQRILGRVANLESQNRIIMLVEPGEMLSGREMTELGDIK